MATDDRPLRIALLSYRGNPNSGGQGVYVHYLTRELVAFVQTLRTMDLRKSPSISETVDWARALVLLHADSLAPDVVRDALAAVLGKNRLRTVELTTNYRTILDYNCSNFYALTVGLLADSVAR